MLASHKLAAGSASLHCRWHLSACSCSPRAPWASVLVGLGTVGFGAVALNRTDSETFPGLVKRAGFAVASALAGFIAWMKFFAGTNAEPGNPRAGLTPHQVGRES